METKVEFDWRKWLKAEGFGTVFATLLCFGLAGALVYYDGDWKLAAFMLIVWLWLMAYCGGWQLLCLAILNIRARYGWISYQVGDTGPTKGNAPRIKAGGN